MLYILAGAIVGALARRIAGGVVAIPGGTLVARALAAVWLAGGMWWLAPGGVVWWHVAILAPLFFAGMASGFPPGGMVPVNAAHVGGISQQHGWALIGPMAVWAAALDLTWWPLVLASAIVGPIYWAATWWQPSVPWLGFNKHGSADPPAWAEVWVGAAMGAALVVALRF